jgi:hypothetical protein
VPQTLAGELSGDDPALLREVASLLDAYDEPLLEREKAKPAQILHYARGCVVWNR